MYSAAKSAWSRVITSGGHRRMEFCPAPRISSPRSKAMSTTLVAQVGRALFGSLVANHFEADHQAQAAHVADMAETRAANPACGPADSSPMQCRVRHQLALQQVEGGQRRRDRDRIAAIGGGVRAGTPLPSVRRGPSWR